MLSNPSIIEVAAHEHQATMRREAKNVFLARSQGSAESGRERRVTLRQKVAVTTSTVWLAFLLTLHFVSAASAGGGAAGRHLFM